MPKPYTVWWKRQDEWKMLFDTHNPTEAKEYARNNISHSGITQRIEIRDHSGALEIVFDSAWI